MNAVEGTIVPNINGLAELSKALAAKQVDRFEVGTVIRWTSADRYTYAVIKAGNGRWYVTGAGRFYGTDEFGYEELLDILGRSEVSGRGHGLGASRVKCWCGNPTMTDGSCSGSPYHYPAAVRDHRPPQRLYVSGPMSGIAECNYPAFHEAERQLRRAGYDVRNPAHSQLAAGGAAYEDLIREDLVWLMECDAVALLPGHEDSRGSQLEQHVARVLGLPIKPLAEWLTQTPARTAVEHENKEN
jgi:hypothetical protein